MRVCLVGAENDALPGAKVGGIGDVLRDLPGALAAAGCAVTVLVPSYGTLHALPGAHRRAVFTTGFRGLPTRVEAWSVAAVARARAGVPGPRADAPPDAARRGAPVRPAGPGAGEVDTLVLHHPDFAACGAGRIYCDDPPGRPFATDASKFALFSAAALDALLAGLAGPVEALDAVHLHDWHAATGAILREYDPAYAALRPVRLVLSVHNLALQGIRPFAGDASALEAWFPHLDYPAEALADPRWSDCVNPVAAGIRLADAVHTVSPTYAREILEPNDPARGFHGGEGLEADLGRAAAERRLIGILNGIGYPADRGDGGDGGGSTEPWPTCARALAADFLRGLLAGAAAEAPLRAVDYVAHRRLVEAAERPRPRHLLVSVGRLVEQKVAILLEPLEDGRPALAHLLEAREDLVLVLVGSGDPALEARCAALAASHPNLVFAARYAHGLAERLFGAGDLFLMPSSFEPCGISQMLAMRAGQPCLVHAVGGLVDTVRDGIDGFAFAGDSRPAQARAMLERLETALALRESEPERFAAIRTRARARRFDWGEIARRYLEALYAT